MLVSDDLVDEASLKHLDSQVNGKYGLVVCNDTFGLRGIDYRAPRHGITLVIAASFSNQRELRQALSRVGRYGDPCERVSFVATAVDENKELAYKSRLMQISNLLEKKKVVIKHKTPTPKKKNQPTQGQQGIEKFMNKRQQELLKRQ